MAKKHSGDWRNSSRIRQWAAELAVEIPNVMPGQAVDHPAASKRRLALHGLLGWALCTATMFSLLKFVSMTSALVIHAIAAPLFFTMIAWRYFRARGARDALITAIIWTAIVALLDLTFVAGVALRSLEMFRSIAGTWLPFGLIFLFIWTTGEIILMLPETKIHAPNRMRDHKWSPARQ